MAQPTPTRRRIAATENDLKNNRLGLMSQQQIDNLQKHIEQYQARIHEVSQRAIGVGSLVTIVIIILVLLQILIVPIAVAIEVVVVSGMIYLTIDFNRFVQQLTMDEDARAVRIVKGRASRYSLRSHPLYQILRVEVQNYKVVESSLVRQFENGELYQLYVLPQSRVVIAAEKISESAAGALQ